MFGFVAEMVLQLVCGLSGHALLWLMTLGRQKPFDASNSLAMLVGVAFYGLVIAGTVMLSCK